MTSLKSRERTLKDYVESLIAVCNLEKNTGFIDRSVFGGLDRLLSQWSLRETINPLFDKFNKVFAQYRRSLPINCVLNPF